MPDNSWSDADIIDRYTRRQAIEDGVLVQLSGPGYQGDQWIPAMVAEAGFRHPVAMTATAFCRYVSPLEGDDALPRHQGPPVGRAVDAQGGNPAHPGPATSCASAYGLCPMSRQTIPNPTRQGPRSCISRPCAAPMTTVRHA